MENKIGEEVEDGGSSPAPPPFQVPEAPRGPVLDRRGKGGIYTWYGTSALNWMFLSLLLSNGNNWDSTRDVQFSKSFLRFHYMPGTILGTWLTMTPMNTADRDPCPSHYEWGRRSHTAHLTTVSREGKTGEPLPNAGPSRNQFQQLSKISNCFRKVLFSGKTLCSAKMPGDGRLK